MLSYACFLFIYTVNVDTRKSAKLIIVVCNKFLSVVIQILKFQVSYVRSSLAAVHESCSFGQMISCFCQHVCAVEIIWKTTKQRELLVPRLVYAPSGN